MVLDDSTYATISQAETSSPIQKEGIISLGRLAEILGIDPVGARVYLKQQEIGLFGQNSQELIQDIANA